MSFVSGLMLGASIGKGIHDVMMGQKKTAAVSQPKPGKVCPVAPVINEFDLVSSVAGRRRYRIATLCQNAPLAVLLEKQLKRLDYVTRVQANPATGSLLIEYKATEAVMDRLAAALRDRVVSVGDASGEKTEKTSIQPTLYARSWRGTGSFINDMVRKATFDCFDISTLLSLFFMIRGIRKMVLYGERPNGPSMIWWSLHLMKGWRG